MEIQYIRKSQPEKSGRDAFSWTTGGFQRELRLTGVVILNEVKDLF
jgi:hypothetical protein